ncbi:RNA-binding protein [Aestuariibacter sp. AA17]|uniref:RNA-binding protein n=1 Tax=Fluctibacter corallii TaxID=2984329 RepID=A0ABT3AD71_9ALTE|nr:RNA-binding protein [Aestuariibacter sp. AA17]MCV2886624.1 RNA-binding protein [Aestuariibacter sp. AA17]
MNSSVIIYIVLSTILALLGQFFLPSELLPSNSAFAIGVLIGGLLIPLIVSLVSKEESTSTGTKAVDSTTLYVGNLPYRANEQAVKEHFSELGNVHSVRLMKDRRTGKRKGYGFVEMDSKDADHVIKTLNDSEFQERTLKVRLAREKAETA